MDSQCHNCNLLISENQLLKSKLNDIRRTVREQIREANKVKNTLTTIYEDIGKVLLSTEVRTTSHCHQNGSDQKKLKPDLKLNDIYSSSLSIKSGHNQDELIESSSNERTRKRKLSATSSTSSNEGGTNLSDNQGLSSIDSTTGTESNDGSGILVKRVGRRPRQSQPVILVPPSSEQQQQQLESTPPIQLKPLKLPTIRINPNLNKIKLEQDYNPIVPVKEEPELEIIMEIPPSLNSINRKLTMGQRIARRKQIINNWLNRSINRSRPILPSEMLVLSDASLLSSITDCFELDNLKLCRLVNKEWKSIATQIMRKRKCCLVKIMWDKDSGHFRHWTSKCALNDLIHKSLDLPSSDITILGNGNLADCAMSNFFILHGDKIKNLDIKCYSTTPKTVDTPKHVFVNILNNQTPNLEKLTILGCNYDDWTDQDKLYLPSLKIFEWKYAEGTAYKILEGSPNLEIVHGFSLNRDLDYLIQFKKIHTIKEIVCTGKENSEHLIKFANSNPQLRRVEFSISEYPLPEISKAFNLLLKTNMKTLTALSLGQVWFRDGIQIPMLSHLKVLEFGENSDKQPCFPKGIKLKETFPFLQTFDVTGLSGGKDADFNIYFPPPDPFYGNLKTVETLKMGDCSEFWMKQLNFLCPNFTRLAIYSDSQLQTTLPRVFRLWTHVQYLELQAKNDIICSAMSLDPAFTGLSEETCLRLRNSKHNLQEGGYRGLKSGPSIDALKDLKSLRIIFNYTVNSVPFPLSKLCGIYGFSLLPNLQVIIEIPRHISAVKIAVVKDILGPYATVRAKIF